MIDYFKNHEKVFICLCILLYIINLFIMLARVFSFCHLTYKLVSYEIVHFIRHTTICFFPTLLTFGVKGKRHIFEILEKK